MILFNNSFSIPGVTISDSLAYVYNCDIDSTRTNMSGYVQFIPLDQTLQEHPNWTPYAQKSYVNVPYDYSLPEMPAEQFYNWLMLQPEYEGGIKYPV